MGWTASWDWPWINTKTKTQWDENGFTIDGIHQATWTKRNPQWYDKNGFNSDWIHQITWTIYDEEWYDIDGYDIDGYDQFGYDRGGYDRNWYNREWYDRMGYDKNWYDREGYDRDWWNRKWINKFTGTEYDKNWYNREGYTKNNFDRNGIHKITKSLYDEHGFDIKGFHRRTWSQYDEEWYDQSWKDEYWHNRRDNQDYRLGFFTEDWIANRKIIDSYLKRKWSSYQEAHKKVSNDRNDFRDLDKDDQEFVLLNGWFCPFTRIIPIPPRFENVSQDPYFFCCLMNNNERVYISNHDISINNGNLKIIPYTNSDVHKIRYNENMWQKKRLINFVAWKITSISSQRITKISITNTTEIPNKNDTNWKSKKSWISDISKSLQEEQNQVMSAPTEWVILISWVAGSWKTNVLLHRIQYLLWEQPWKKNDDDIVFTANNMLFLCYNKALQKYIESSIKDNFSEIQVKTFDSWRTEIFSTYFHKKPDFNYDKDFSIIEAKNIINKYLADVPNSLNLNDLSGEKDQYDVHKRLVKKIKEFYVEKTRWEYNFYEHWQINKQGVSTVDINPILMEKIFWKNIVYTQKHLYTRLYLLSITKIKQDSPNTFCLQIGEREFSGLKTWHNNKNIQYSFNKPFYDHIFIDEVQDLTPSQIQIVNGFHNNSMTLAWDESQLLTNQSLSSNLSDFFWITINHKYDLKTSHRISQQTALFANEFLKNVKFKNDIQFISFKWLKPLVINTDNKWAELQYLVDNIRELQSNAPTASICVMFPKKNDVNDSVIFLKNQKIDCYSANAWSWDFSKSVHVTNYHQAKWLEFDYVFICWINEFDTRNVKNKNNVIYTLITRWIKRVYITITWEFPSIFTGINNNLYEYKTI